MNEFHRAVILLVKLGNLFPPLWTKIVRFQNMISKSDDRCLAVVNQPEIIRPLLEWYKKIQLEDHRI